MASFKVSQPLSIDLLHFYRAAAFVDLEAEHSSDEDIELSGMDGQEDGYEPDFVQYTQLGVEQPGQGTLESPKDLWCIIEMIQTFQKHQKNAACDQCFARPNLGDCKPCIH